MKMLLSATKVTPESPDSSPDGTENTPSRGVSPSLDMLVDEHEEEVSENGQTVRRKGVYLLPNLFTTGALFCGFYSVISAIRGDFEAAAIAIIFAAVFDGLDGRIARLTNTQSKFGAQYDSLADVVSFGAVPALVVYTWALSGLGKVGWSAAFVYLACAALRLARFNTQADTVDSHFFIGLASPAAAGTLASAVWVCHDLGWVGDDLPFEMSIVMAFLTALMGILRIANFRYYRFKGLDFRGRVPFVAMIVMVLIFGIATLDPALVFLITGLSYAILGPLVPALRGRRDGS